MTQLPVELFYNIMDALVRLVKVFTVFCQDCVGHYTHNTGVLRVSPQPIDVLYMKEASYGYVIVHHEIML